MRYRVDNQGFTIVELLIVIVVIAILAAITVVAFNGIQQRGRNAQMISAAKSYVTGLKFYRTDRGNYPSAPEYAVCLGKGYPADRCWTSTANNGTYDVSTVFNNEISEYIRTIPSVPVKTYQLQGTETRSGMVYYRNNPSGSQSIEYALEGSNQDCSLSGAAAQNISGNTTTKCTIVLN